MKRREVITLLGGAAAAWPALANAQQPAKPPTIGYLGPNSRLLDGQRLSAFVQRLRELGWIEDRTITIEYRWADGRNEHLADIAADFVRRKVDVIVTSATPPTVAAKQATSVIPIVFAAVGDPVGSGVVKSLARPGGNATGLSLQATDAVGKRLQLLGEVITGLRRLAIMANSANPSAALEMREAEDTARTLGLEGVTSEIRRSEDIARAFDAIKGRRGGPLRLQRPTRKRRYTRCPQFYYFISRAGGQMGLIAAYGCTMWWSALATLAGRTRSTFGASAVVRYAQAGAE